MQIHLPDGRETVTVLCEPGETILAALRRAGLSPAAPCGGEGRCGGCRVRLLKGTVSGEPTAPDGTVRACRAVPNEDVTVAWQKETLPVLPFLDDCDAVLDLGTTTMVLSLYERKTGRFLPPVSVHNPQRSYGADVAARISAAAAFGIRALSDPVAEVICALLVNSRPHRLFVCGNPTMTALFLRMDPSPIGTAPYRTPQSETLRLAGEELGIPAEQIIVPAPVSAYFGSDAICAVMAADPEPQTLLLDVGTNTELCYYGRTGYFAATAPAGPAMEGGGIRYGVGGVPGAVFRAYCDGDRIRVRTVGDAPIRGIAASGLCDLCAALCRLGALTDEGHLSPDPYPVGNGVTLSGEDVRAFLLAKGAIRAAADLLPARDGSTPQKLLLTGGGGTHLRVESARETGLLQDGIPAASAENLAFAGLCRFPENTEETLARYEEIRRAVTVVDLTAAEDFTPTFLERLTFPHAMKRIRNAEFGIRNSEKTKRKY